MLLQRPLDADGAGYSLSRGGEGYHEAVAQALHLMAAVLLDLLAREVALGTHYLLRGLVAPTGRQVGGADDICEEHGDGAFWKLLGHGGQPLRNAPHCCSSTENSQSE